MKKKQKPKECKDCGVMVPYDEVYQCEECRGFMCYDCYADSPYLCESCKKEEEERT